MNHPPQKPGFVLAWIGVVTFTVFVLSDFMPAPEAGPASGGDPSTAAATAGSAPDAGTSDAAHGTNGEHATLDLMQEVPGHPVFEGSPAFDRIQADRKEEPGGAFAGGEAARVERPRSVMPGAIPVTNSGGTQHTPLRAGAPVVVASGGVRFHIDGRSDARSRAGEDEPEKVEAEIRPLGRHARLMRLVIWLRDLETAEEQIEAVLDWLPDEASAKLRRHYRKDRGQGGGEKWDLARLRKNAGRLGENPRVEMLLALDSELARELKARLVRLVRARRGASDA